jgi:hypothetical protein
MAKGKKQEERIRKEEKNIDYRKDCRKSWLL